MRRTLLPWSVSWTSGGRVTRSQLARRLGVVTDDWFWEGHVQAATVAHLVRSGWTIERVADTARREQGIDVIASKDGRRLAVEVKGFPSALYARGSKAGQPKPTSPALQARHWFAGALLASILTTSKLGRSELALALPDVPRYRALIEQARWALQRLGIGVYLVREGGVVERLLDHDERT
jgi:hypothetical protein